MGIHKSLGKGKAAKAAPVSRKTAKPKTPPQAKLHKAMASAKVARPASAGRDIMTKLRATPASAPAAPRTAPLKTASLAAVRANSAPVRSEKAPAATAPSAARKPATEAMRRSATELRPAAGLPKIATAAQAAVQPLGAATGPARTPMTSPILKAQPVSAPVVRGPLPKEPLLKSINPLPLDKKVAPMPSSAAKILKTDKPEMKPEIKKKLDFRSQDWVVYPAHGVGRIVSIEENEVAGMKLELFVINFEKDKMTLRVPVAKAKAVGMRRLSSPDVVQNALATLKGRARIKRTMWSRRAQEYEQKIHSGDLISIAEVVRDLHRASGQPEQSYSERQLYEAAIARLAREVAAVEKIDEDAAMKRLETALLKAAA